MEELKEKLEELMEVENLDLNSKFSEYEEWDSLTSLSVLALLDSDYGMAMSHKNILAFDSIGAFCMYVMEHKTK